MGNVIHFILGVFFWTFLEYVLHRFLGHSPKGMLKKTRFFKEHKKHHYIKNYFVTLKDKLLTAVFLGVCTTLIFHFLIHQNISKYFLLGLLSMYFFYEIIHRRLHLYPPKNRYASFLRHHHNYHHYVDDTMNHGVTSPLWDLVFRTFKDSSFSQK